MSRPEYSKGGNIRVYSPAGLILDFYRFDLTG